MATQPLPRIEPLIPTLVAEPFHRRGWVYEEKYDGWRILAYKDGQRVRLLSPTGHDHAARFPDVTAAVAALAAPTLILDGEVCVFDAKLVSHRHLLQDPDEFAPPPVFIGFDCLYFHGRDLRGVALSQRRRSLEDVTVASGVYIARRLARHGLQAWEDVKERGCEGMVAKEETAPYIGGPSQSWQKIKVRREGAFYVLGLLQSEGGVAGIVVGERDGDETNHAGIVESGFSRRELAELLSRARPLVRRQAPLPHAAHLDVLWLEPKLVALVMYLEQVSGRLREPVYRGLITA